MDVLDERDLKFILMEQFPDIWDDLLDQMIAFNEKLSSQVGITWAYSGSPWEMNLRDVTRWCEITMADYKQNSRQCFNPGKGAQLLYIDRMRTRSDKDQVRYL